MTEQKDGVQNPADETDLKRRKLLRGIAAGVPVIATVRPDGAAAMSNTICIAKSGAQALTDNQFRNCLPVNNSNDPSSIDWFREDYLTPNGNNTRSCVTYFDQNGVPFPANSGPGNGGNGNGQNSKLQANINNGLNPVTVSCMTSFV